MNCTEAHPLVHAYADGELDVVRSIDVEEHIKSCVNCSAARDSVLSLRSALRQGNLRFTAPESLRRNLAQLQPQREPKKRSGDSASWLWQWLAIGATAFALITLMLRPAGFSGRDRLLDEAIDNHIRSLMASHLTDVISSDQHTVKPWFNGRIDFAPAVKDFAAQGFPLIGGRLDYLRGHTVAALVYQRNKHFINVFVWPSEQTFAVGEKSEERRGYSIINLDVNEMHYCLVSDLNAKELNELAGLLGN